MRGGAARPAAAGASVDAAATVARSCCRSQGNSSAASMEGYNLEGTKKKGISAKRKREVRPGLRPAVCARTEQGLMRSRCAGAPSRQVLAKLREKK